MSSISPFGPLTVKFAVTNLQACESSFFAPSGLLDGKEHTVKTKLTVSVAIVAAAGLFSSAAFAAYPVVQVNDKIKFADGNGDSPGGAFILTDWGSTGTVNKGSFESFCLEKNEYMNYGSGNVVSGTGPSFKVVSISEEARKGGAGGQIALPYPHDPLDVRTAFLYTKYIEDQSALNAVAGWSAASLVQKGTAMQQAIWTIEQEMVTTNALANSLITFAGASGWTNTGRVHVLNLVWNTGGGGSYPAGTYAQDQLYLAPVPEPETYAMMLAGLGLLGFMARRRRRDLSA